MRHSDSKMFLIVPSGLVVIVFAIGSNVRGF
jgi:hypothetical protein